MNADELSEVHVPSLEKKKKKTHPTHPKKKKKKKKYWTKIQENANTLQWNNSFMCDVLRAHIGKCCCCDKSLSLTKCLINVNLRNHHYQCRWCFPYWFLFSHCSLYDVTLL